MPDGNRFASGTIAPDVSRETCQQSSMTTYWYPASRMPLATMASAVSLMRASLTSHWKRFQLFHPIGGVRARSIQAVCEAGCASPATLVPHRIANSRALLPTYRRRIGLLWKMCASYRTPGVESPACRPVAMRGSVPVRSLSRFALHRGSTSERSERLDHRRGIGARFQDGTCAWREARGGGPGATAAERARVEPGAVQCRSTRREEVDLSAASAD